MNKSLFNLTELILGSGWRQSANTQLELRSFFFHGRFGNFKSKQPLSTSECQPKMLSLE